MEMHAGGRADGRPAEHGRGSTRVDERAPSPRDFVDEAVGEDEALLLTCATKEPLLEKTADAHSSDGAVDEDDPSG
jgi:hypothetical protein